MALNDCFCKPGKWMNFLSHQVTIQRVFNHYYIFVLLFLNGFSAFFTFFIPLIIKNANVFVYACITVQWIINMQLENWKFWTWTYSYTHARWVECVLFIIMCAHICERTILLFTKIGSHLLLWNGENENEKKQRDIQTICTVNKSFCTFAHKGADTSAIHLRQWRQKKFNQFQEHNEREQEQGKRFSSCAFDLHIFCVCKMSNLNGMTCMCVWVYQWDGVW